MKTFSYKEFENYNPICITVRGTYIMQKTEITTDDEGNEVKDIHRVYITRHTFNAICECMNKHEKYAECDEDLPMFIENRKDCDFICVPKFA